ncbi:MAG TPA: polysaccharide biosynthesis/export family protein [Gemmatimonadales bacterium]
MTLGSRVVPSRRWRFLLVLLALVPARLTGQDSLPVDDAGRKPIATRADLESALTQAEQIAASDGYSGELRDQKRAEAALIRERLREGDFQVGDQITMKVTGDSSLTGTMTVGPGKIISLANYGDIPMTGVLRSEANEYLKQQLSKWIKNPEVEARSLIRLSVLGGVSKPGFYQLDSGMLLSDALQAAGGIGNSTDLHSSIVKRGEEEIVSKEVFYEAVTVGRTLDALNLRAGDEITVGTQKTTDWLQTLRTFAIIPALIISLYGLGRLFGIFN